MPAMTQAVRKLKTAERKFERAENRIEGKVKKFLEKDGAAERLARAMDQATAEASRDLDYLGKKWSAKIKKLGEAFRKESAR